jgi:type III secretion protein L
MNGDLPREPAIVIIPASSAACWQDGYAWLAEARQQLEEANASCEHIRQVADRRGYEEGLRKGEQAAVRLLARTRQELDGYLANLAPQLTELIAGTMRRLLGRYDAVDLIAHFVEQGMRNLPTGEAPTLWVSPAQAVALANVLAGVRLHLRADTSLDDHHALLVGLGASIDVSPDHQLACMLSELAGPVGDLAEGFDHG